MARVHSLLVQYAELLVAEITPENAPAVAEPKTKPYGRWGYPDE
jgi:hypothetical protein